MLLPVLALSAQALLAPPPPVAPVRPAAPAALARAWDRGHVEHLWNRAGFGIAEADIEAWAAAGPDALVDHLLDRPDLPADFDVGAPPYTGPEVRALKGKERQEANRAARRWSNERQAALVGWWCDELLDPADPLGDRMTLFWQGLLTSADDTVRDARMMAAQHALLRRHALGSYADLLRGILRDPAMLVYLNNNQNRKGRPNENLAREVMELFSLGIGNYTERDVKEAARALTGHTVTDGAYRLARGQHDAGEKTILGVTGAHDLDDLADILLAQPACARHVAGRLIEYLEGLPPEEPRLARYASLLRDCGYELAPLVRALLVDPDFYRPEVRGARVASPVDFLVGASTRLGLTAADRRPPAAFVARGASLLGQTLFRPPNVKGWDEGLAWMTTSTFMQRGSLAGALVGALDAPLMRAERDRLAAVIVAARATALQGDDAEPLTLKAAQRQAQRQLGQDQLVRAVNELRKSGWSASVPLTAWVQGALPATDAEVCDLLLEALLAIEPPLETRRLITAELRRAREAAGLSVAALAAEEHAAHLVRLAHLILSLPEAQLH